LKPFHRCRVAGGMTLLILPWFLGGVKKGNGSKPMDITMILPYLDIFGGKTLHSQATLGFDSSPYE